MERTAGRLGNVIMKGTVFQGFVSNLGDLNCRWWTLMFHLPFYLVNCNAKMLIGHQMFVQNNVRFSFPNFMHFMVIF